MKYGAEHGLWKGGRTVAAGGYIAIKQRGHPRASNSGYVLEHILVVEKALGRYVPAGADIHHVDENPGNNAGSNLVLCPDSAYHKLLHQRLRAFIACGNASALRCCICHGYEDQADIKTTTGPRAYHRRCATAYNRANVAKRRGTPDDCSPATTCTR